MHTVPKLFSWFICASFTPVPFVHCSSVFMLKPSRSNVSKHQGDSQKAFDIALHGILLWASMGFLMPVGILVIRMSGQHGFHRTRLKVFFYFHAILQVCSVLLATAGAVLSIRNFENSFNNCHQRVGLALYVAIYVQVLTGFRRPRRGSRPRCIWYFFHWIVGTEVSIVGIFNTFTGFKAYHSRTSKSTSLWTILFTAQLSLMAILFLIQDKWDYIQKQGLIRGNEPTIPSVEGNAELENKTDASTTETNRKSNALGTYFSRSNALNKLFQIT